MLIKVRYLDAWFTQTTNRRSYGARVVISVTAADPTPRHHVCRRMLCLCFVYFCAGRVQEEWRRGVSVDGRERSGTGHSPTRTSSDPDRLTSLTKWSPLSEVVPLGPQKLDGSPILNVVEVSSGRGDDGVTEPHDHRIHFVRVSLWV